MVGKTKAPNKTEREHMDAVRALGCITHRVGMNVYMPAEIHHVTDCGRRMGHMYVLGLCAWCHRGVPPNGYRPSQAEQVFGPSLARSKRDFTKAYGTERELLEIVNEWLIRSAA